MYDIELRKVWDSEFATYRKFYDASFQEVEKVMERMDRESVKENVSPDLNHPPYNTHRFKNRSSLDHKMLS